MRTWLLYSPFICLGGASFFLPHPFSSVPFLAMHLLVVLADSRRLEYPGRASRIECKQLNNSDAKEEVHATSTQPVLSDPPFPFLLWPGSGSQAENRAADRGPPHRGSASSTRLPGVAVEWRNAKADEPEDRAPAWQVRDLLGEIYRLHRCSPGPHPAAWPGWRMARRSPGQHSGRALVVQRREGVQQMVRQASNTASSPRRLFNT